MCLNQPIRDQPLWGSTNAKPSRSSSIRRCHWVPWVTYCYSSHLTLTLGHSRVLGPGLIIPLIIHLGSKIGSCKIKCQRVSEDWCEEEGLIHCHCFGLIIFVSFILALALLGEIQSRSKSVQEVQDTGGWGQDLVVSWDSSYCIIMWSWPANKRAVMWLTGQSEGLWSVSGLAGTRSSGARTLARAESSQSPVSWWQPASEDVTHYARSSLQFFSAEHKSAVH